MGQLLSTYLNDHFAGSTAALELARRTARANQGTSYGQMLEQLTDEIAEDRRALEQIMASLGVREDRAKVALAWGAEKLGRLKLNGRLFSYSPLSRLEELEALAIGVEGKLLLWQALVESHGHDARLADVEFGELQDRARAQKQKLRAQRHRAAVEALR